MARLAGLHAQRTGEGQFLDVGMVDAIMSMCEPAMMMFSYMGRPVLPAGNQVRGITPFDIFESADGHCAIATPTEKHWRILCDAIGRPDLKTDERTSHNRARNKNRDFVDETVGAWAREHTNAEIAEVLGGKVAVGPVHTAESWFDDPHVKAREMLVAVENPAGRPNVQPNTPFRLTKTPAGVYRRAPILDEHGDEIRAELAERRADGGAAEADTR